MVKVEQQLDLALKSTGIAVDLHPTIIIVGIDPVVLGRDNQLLMALRIKGGDSGPDQLHGHKFRMPVNGQHAFLVRKHLSRLADQLLLSRGKFGGGNSPKTPLVFGGNFLMTANQL